MAVEVGSGFVSIVPSAKGFGRKLQGAVGPDAEREGKRSGGLFGRRFADGSIGPIKAGFGKLAGVASGALAGLAIGGLIKGSVKAASDLAESVSKVGVVFGDSAGEVKKFAKTAATSLGTSEQKALEATGTFGNLFVALKIGQKPAAAMSTKLVALAGDLASFNNVDPAQALDALRSGLTGETEPLKKFGVNLNDATLKQKALELGLTSTTKGTLPPAIKAQAAYALILEQTKTAQGDFTRTSGGLANQQRILSAQFDDLKAKIGKGLLPVVTAIVRFLNEKAVPAFRDHVVPALRGVSDFVTKTLIPVLKGLVTFFTTTIGDAVGKFVAGLQSAFGKVNGKSLAAPIIASITAGFTTGNWAPVGKAISAGIVGAIRALGSFAGELTNSLTKAVQGVDWRKVGESLGTRLGDLINGVLTTGGGVGKAVGDGFAKVDWGSVGKAAAFAAVPFVAGFVTNLLNAIVSYVYHHPLDALVFALSIVPIGRIAGILGTFVSKIPIVGKLLGPLLHVVEGTGGLFEKAWGKLFGGLGKVFDFLAPGVRAKVKDFMDTIVTTVFVHADDMLKAGQHLIGGLINGIVGRLAEVRDLVFLLIRQHIIGPFARAVSWLFRPGAAAVNGLTRGITSAVGSVSRVIGNVIARILTPFRVAGTWLLNAGIGVVRGLVGGITSAAASVGRVIANLIGRVKAPFVAAGTWLVNAGLRIVRGLAGGINSGVRALGANLAAIRNRAVGVFANAGSWLVNAGVRLVKGFADGIGSAFHFVRDKLGELTGKLTDWKGPPSRDAKILEPSGRLVIKGFIRGLEREIPNLRSQLEGITSSLPGLTIAAVGETSTSASTAGNMTLIQNFHNPLPERASVNAADGARRARFALAR